MNSEYLQLRPLRVEDEKSFRLAVSEFKETEPGWRFAFDYNESMSFSDYVKLLELWSVGKGLPENFVTNTFLVAVIHDKIVGRVSIRHSLNDFLERIGGHIGYGVIPSQRKRGYATEMLRQALQIAGSLGIDRVLITCDVDNVASRRVIEKNDGIFEGLTNASELDIQKRRYWIDVI